MKHIGGYFELETNDFGSVYHDNAIAVNSGRNGLEYILKVKKFKKVYIPYYTCDVTLQPINKLNIEHEFYHLDQGFNPDRCSLKDDEALIFVNYFGIFNQKVNELKKLNKHIIVDNSQAFFAKPLNDTMTFYSPRKFFGLPDGGFIYLNNTDSLDLSYSNSADKISHLIKRVEEGAEAGYLQFKENDKKLDNQPLQKMSKLTEKLLKNINFSEVLRKRDENFNTLHSLLSAKNDFTSIIESEAIFGPMVYPFLRANNSKLRELLINNKIFVAKYWPNVTNWLDTESSYEGYLTENLLAIPIDQRYSTSDMKEIVKIVLKHL